MKMRQSDSIAASCFAIALGATATAGIMMPVQANSDALAIFVLCVAGLGAVAAVVSLFASLVSGARAVAIALAAIVVCALPWVVIVGQIGESQRVAEHLAAREAEKRAADAERFRVMREERDRAAREEKVRALNERRLAEAARRESAVSEGSATPSTPTMPAKQRNEEPAPAGSVTLDDSLRRDAEAAVEPHAGEDRRVEWPPLAPSLAADPLPMDAAATIGGATVRLLGASVGPVVIERGVERITLPTPRLLVRVRIDAPGSAASALQYTTWRDGARAQLPDRSELRPRGSGLPGAVAGGVEAVAIPPGGFVEDVLIFEAPDDPGAHVLLSLPAANLGDAAGPGAAFRIPGADPAPRADPGADPGAGPGPGAGRRP